MRYIYGSKKRLQVELDEIENGFQVYVYGKHDSRRIYAETLDDALALIKNISKTKGEKKK